MLCFIKEDVDNKCRKWHVDARKIVTINKQLADQRK